VRKLGEPESGEGQAGPTKIGTVPEGAEYDAEFAADPPFSDRLSALRSRRESAGALDLAAALDEPEQLIRYLVIAAQEHIGFSQNEAKWKVILGHAAQAAKELERLNEPTSHRGAKTSSL
jgi:hypothetical protein